MAAAAASYFSGTAFMPSQRAGPAADAHDYAASGAATPSPSKVRVLGKVETVVSGETDVSFTLDDGTGKIPLVRWITDDADARDAAYVKAGVYVRVHVDITGFQANQQGFARSIRPITNFNEVVLHFIECIHVHIENTRPKFSAYSGTGGQQHDLQSKVLKVLQAPDIM
ncbi:hypothetical protein ACQ4PT_012719 [Festuca glaucescens]